jgi:uncharacterized protein (TIGR00730 family)
LKHPSDTAPSLSKPSAKNRTKTVQSPVNGATIEPARTLKSVCVYCGSGAGTNPIYAETARTLGRSLAENGVALVYGGGGLGLMGEVARATLEAGGKVTGIIPEFLTAREHMLREVTDLVVTSDMHQRKKLMYERSDAFIALPGGVGTLEELVEQLTWSQLGQHSKPIVLANIADFWSPFLKLLEHMRQEAFIRPGLEVRFGVVTNANQIVPHVQELFARTAGEAKPALVKF